MAKPTLAGGAGGRCTPPPSHGGRRGRWWAKHHLPPAPSSSQSSTPASVPHSHKPRRFPRAPRRPSENSAPAAGSPRALGTGPRCPEDGGDGRGAQSAGPALSPFRWGSFLQPGHVTTSCATHVTPQGRSGPQSTWGSGEVAPRFRPGLCWRQWGEKALCCAPGPHRSCSPRADPGELGAQHHADLGRSWEALVTFSPGAHLSFH